MALLVGGAEALHQGRYHLAAAAHGGGAEHAYLQAVTPIVLALVALAAAEFLLLLERARASSPEPRPIPRVVDLWAAASAALLAIYAFQETLEGMLGTGASLARLFGAGGWVVVLLAVAIGGVIALLLRGSAVALELVAVRRRPRRRGDRRSRRAPLFSATRGSLNAIARFMAGRGPPAAV